MNRDILEMVGEWAQDRVASGEEPPWTYFKLKQLAELTQDLAAGLDVVTHHTVTEPSNPHNIVSLESFRKVPKGELRDEFDLPL